MQRIIAALALLQTLQESKIRGYGLSSRTKSPMAEPLREISSAFCYKRLILYIHPWPKLAKIKLRVSFGRTNSCFFHQHDSMPKCRVMLAETPQILLRDGYVHI